MSSRTFTNTRVGLPDRRGARRYRSLTGTEGRSCARGGWLTRAGKESRKGPHRRRNAGPGRADWRIYWIDALVTELQKAEGGRTLVFVRTKRGADKLTRILRDRKLKADTLHGNLSQAKQPYPPAFESFLAVNINL